MHKLKVEKIKRSRDEKTLRDVVTLMRNIQKKAKVEEKKTFVTPGRRTEESSMTQRVEGPRWKRDCSRGL